MILGIEDRIGRGAFADVFASGGSDRVVKVFRRLHDPSITQAVPYIHRAEVSAFEIVARDAELQRYAPQYFGTRTIERVLNRSGRSMSGRYWLECAYEMERLAPDPLERKLGSFFETEEWPQIEPIEQLFEKAGILHLGDASVMHWAESRPVLIDFAVSDAAADHWRDRSGRPNER